jgi:hypothetical protein
MDAFSRRAVAKALGTAILVTTVVGSSIIVETLTKESQTSTSRRPDRKTNHAPLGDLRLARSIAYTCRWEYCGLSALSRAWQFSGFLIRR